MLTQCLRKDYAIITQSLRNSITQHYAIVLRNCFTQLFYAIVLRNCFTQLFYAFLRMSVKEKFTQKSCNLRKGQLADAEAESQGVVKVFLELSNKNCDHGSHIPEVQLGEVSRLKLRV